MIQYFLVMHNITPLMYFNVTKAVFLLGAKNFNPFPNFF